MSNENYEKVVEILEKNLDEISKHILWSGGDFVPDLWIFGNLGSDEITFSVNTSSTRPNSENYEEGDFVIRTRKWDDIQDVPPEEQTPEVVHELLVWDTDQIEAWARKAKIF